MDCNIKEVDRYTISVGLNDSESYRQEIETERILRLVSNCCKEYGTSYSCALQTGGYLDESGHFTAENSLALSFVDGNADIVNEIAKDLCVFLHQESVLVTVDKVKRYYVSEALDIEL